MATEVKRVYDIEIKGADSINELRSAVEQLNEKLKTLNETSKEYKDTLAQLTELQSKLANAMNGIGDSTQKAADSLKTVKDTATEATQNIKDMGDASEKTKENLENIGGANTIKELKAEIKSLKAEFANLEIGSEGYIDVATQIANEEKRLKAAMQGVKTTVDDASESYNSLSIKMRQLKEEYHATNSVARRNELAPQIAEIQQKLKDMDAAVLVYSRNVGNYSSALDGLDTSFVNLKTQLKEAKEAMQQLDPASQAYADALAKAADITHQLSDQQQMIKYSSTDVGDQLENLRGIASNMAAGYSALNAAMGLFGSENEDVKEAILKVQQAMALVQGLQGMDGLIKRTQGLSNAMKVWIKTSKSSAAATKADAAASAADAAAKGAEATATQSAVAPQLALNAAMAANPIGIILTAIGALVAIFMVFKDKIKELIGSNKEMSAAFDKVKAVLAGFGNVIKKSVINPIKMALIPIKTLAKVIMDLFKGDWSKIGDDIKDGMTEMKDTAIDTINVVGAFKEGYDKKTAEQNEAARKKEAEARQKELENIIKDNEAKYGSDWKYTNDAKKLYEELFKVRMEQYSEDSDEYREAQRDKYAYDREFQEKITSKEKEESTKRAKAAEDAAKARKKLIEDNIKSIEKAYSDFTGKFKQYIDEFSKIRMEIIDGYNDSLSRFVVSFQNGAQKVERNLTDLKKYLIDTMNIKPQDADAFVKSLTEAIGKGVDNLRVVIGGKSIMFSITDQFIKGLQEQYDFTEEEARNTLMHIQEELNKADLDKIAKAKMERIEKEFYNLDRTASEFINRLDSEFELKDLTEGIEFPEEAFLHFENSYRISMQNILNETHEVSREIETVFKSLTEGENAFYKGMENEEDLGKVLPSFQKLLDKRNELEAAAYQTWIDQTKKLSDIQKDAYDLQLNMIETVYEKELNSMQYAYDQEEALQEKKKEWYSGYNVIEGLKRQEDFQNAYYNKVIDQYREEMEVYLDMMRTEELAENERMLTAEERHNAEMEYNRLAYEMEKALNEQRLANLKTQKQMIKEWVAAVKDSISSISDTMSSISDSWSSIIELEQTSIQTELESGKISREEAERRDKENEESFNKLKAFQIVQTIINGLSGAISAYQSMASIPYVGPVLGAAAAAAVGVATAVNVAKIKATQYQSSTSSAGGGSSSSTNFQLPNVMDLEPSMGRNMTNQDNIDDINNDGSGRGEKDIRVVLVESDVTLAQDRTKKVQMETTF